MIMMKFNSDRLKTLRKAKRFNQTDLADRVKVKQSVVSRWESGKNTPSAVVLLNLAAALEVDPLFFYDK